MDTSKRVSSFISLSIGAHLSETNLNKTAPIQKLQHAGADKSSPLKVNQLCSTKKTKKHNTYQILTF